VSYLDDHVNACPIMGHVYSDTLVVRCLHREEVSVTTRTWIDGPDGDTKLLFEFNAMAGPFDSDFEVEQIVQKLNRASTRALMEWSVRSE
jgi:hypothetical protein